MSFRKISTIVDKIRYILQKEASKKQKRRMDCIMKKEEKDVIKRNNLYRLLERICKDFSINDSKETIENFIKKQ